MARRWNSATRKNCVTERKTVMVRFSWWPRGHRIASAATKTLWERSRPIPTTIDEKEDTVPLKQLPGGDRNAAQAITTLPVRERTRNTSGPLTPLPDALRQWEEVKPVVSP